jgi:hypothetical protein
MVGSFQGDSPPSIHFQAHPPKSSSSASYVREEDVFRCFSELIPGDIFLSTLLFSIHEP